MREIKTFLMSEMPIISRIWNWHIYGIDWPTLVLDLPIQVQDINTMLVLLLLITFFSTSFPRTIDLSPEECVKSVTTHKSQRRRKEERLAGDFVLLFRTHQTGELSFFNSRARDTKNRFRLIKMLLIKTLVSLKCCVNGSSLSSANEFQFTTENQQSPLTGLQRKHF